MTEYRVTADGVTIAFDNYMDAEKVFDGLMAEKKAQYCTLKKVDIDDSFGAEYTREIAGFEIVDNGDLIWW